MAIDNSTTSSNATNCVTNCAVEERYLEHYRLKGCEPVYEDLSGERSEVATCDGRRCPLRYDCSKFNARSKKLADPKSKANSADFNGNLFLM